MTEQVQKVERPVADKGTDVIAEELDVASNWTRRGRPSWLDGGAEALAMAIEDGLFESDPPQCK